HGSPAAQRPQGTPAPAPTAARGCAHAAAGGCGRGRSHTALAVLPDPGGRQGTTYRRVRLCAGRAGARWTARSGQLAGVAAQPGRAAATENVPVECPTHDTAHHAGAPEWHALASGVGDPGMQERSRDGS